jgi:hypothetical protein
MLPSSFWSHTSGQLERTFVIEQGAVIVVAGPFTNFMLLEQKYPGILKQADLFLMGGHVFDIPSGYPQWGNEMDYNIQVDMHSAQPSSCRASPPQYGTHDIYTSGDLSLYLLQNQTTGV